MTASCRASGCRVSRPDRRRPVQVCSQVTSSPNSTVCRSTAGTTAPYCDVLRSSVKDHPIAIEVIRFDTGEVWAGELNGTPMEVRYSFAELADEVPDDSGSGGQAVQYEYETVVDDTGTIVVSVPTAWDDATQLLGTWASDFGPVPTIWAAPNLQAFIDSYDYPGMLMIGLPSGASEFGGHRAMPSACSHRTTRVASATVGARTRTAHSSGSWSPGSADLARVGQCRSQSGGPARCDDRGGRGRRDRCRPRSTR